MERLRNRMTELSFETREAKECTVATGEICMVSEYRKHLQTINGKQFDVIVFISENESNQYANVLYFNGNQHNVCMTTEARAIASLEAILEMVGA